MHASEKPERVPDKIRLFPLEGGHGEPGCKSAQSRATDLPAHSREGLEPRGNLPCIVALALSSPVPAGNQLQPPFSPPVARYFYTQLQAGGGVGGRASGVRKVGEKQRRPTVAYHGTLAPLP